jgi:hypothetical protein
MQDASRYRPRYCRLPGHLHHLQHKGLVYTQLERLQSEIVPVYLGWETWIRVLITLHGWIRSE